MSGRIINKIYKFIEYHRVRGDGVLIHSLDAQCRSPVCAAAYLCKKLEWSVERSVQYIRSKRSIAPASILIYKQLQRCVYATNLLPSAVNTQPSADTLLSSIQGNVTVQTVKQWQQAAQQSIEQASSTTSALNQLLCHTYINTYLHLAASINFAHKAATQQQSKAVTWADQRDGQLVRVAGSSYSDVHSMQSAAEISACNAPHSHLTASTTSVVMRPFQTPPAPCHQTSALTASQSHKSGPSAPTPSMFGACTASGNNALARPDSADNLPAYTYNATASNTIHRAADTRSTYFAPHPTQAQSQSCQLPQSEHNSNSFKVLRPQPPTARPRSAQSSQHNTYAKHRHKSEPANAANAPASFNRTQPVAASQAAFLSVSQLSSSIKNARLSSPMRSQPVKTTYRPTTYRPNSAISSAPMQLPANKLWQAGSRATLTRAGSLKKKSSIPQQQHRPSSAQTHTKDQYAYVNRYSDTYSQYIIG